MGLNDTKHRVMDIIPSDMMIIPVAGVLCLCLSVRRGTTACLPSRRVAIDATRL